MWALRSGIRIHYKSLCIVFRASQVGYFVVMHSETTILSSYYLVH